MIPLFQGEVQFRRYSDTSTQGQQIVFSVPDREALQPFIGKEGKRFMAVLVEIGDDEQPINAGTPEGEGKLPSGAEAVSTPPAAPAPNKHELGTICWWLVQRCKEPEFQEWLREGGEKSAAMRVRELCGVGSRTEIEGNPKAEALFNKTIRQPYSLWLNKRGGK